MQTDISCIFNLISYAISLSPACYPHPYLYSPVQLIFSFPRFIGVRMGKIFPILWKIFPINGKFFHIYLEISLFYLFLNGLCIIISVVHSFCLVDQKVMTFCDIRGYDNYIFNGICQVKNIKYNKILVISILVYFILTYWHPGSIYTASFPKYFIETEQARD